MYPVKTQIRPGWAESSLSAWRKLWSLANHWAHSEDWSDWADAQADLSLRWAHSHFVGSVMRCGSDTFSSELFRTACVTAHTVMFLSFLDRQVWANSADPDQTAPRGAVWSGSTLFAIRGAVWSGSTLFATPSASFGCITLRKSHLVQLFGWLQQILGVRTFRNFTVSSIERFTSYLIPGFSHYCYQLLHAILHFI